MGKLIAIDPGATTGWALFENGTLVRCGKVRRTQLHLLPEADELVIEQPRMRRRHPRPDDILKLAQLVGEIVARYPKNTCVPPERWKGQLKKDVCWRRVHRRLWVDELEVVSRIDHNTQDAIGLGLHHLGRMQSVWRGGLP